MANALAGDVEFRLHQIIQEAAKFMHHARRTKLKVEDIDYALKAKNIEPLWGFAAPEPPAYRKTSTPHGNVYFLDDEEIDLTRVLQTPLPPMPRDISYERKLVYIDRKIFVLNIASSKRTGLRLKACSHRYRRIRRKQVSSMCGCAICS